jgi:DNA repair protein RecO (recombination protein O)
VLQKTKGIVFRFTRYGDTSIIVTIFTDQLGLQSYIVNGVRSKSTKSKIALYQPLTLLDMVVYYRENANLNRIKEVKCLYPYHSLHSNVTKSAISMFIAEVLNKAVKEESHAESLCQFLISSLITLDSLDENVENFHLIFLLKLSRFLGFAANNVSEILGWRVTNAAVEEGLQQMLTNDYATRLTMSAATRREALDLIVHFYNDHTGMLGEMKSIQVLREILS